MLPKAKLIKIKKGVTRVDEKLPVMFNALSDVGRFRIFKLLRSYKGLCVSDVADILDVSTPAASQQLRIMELSGLIRRERVGQMICYELRKDDPIVRSLIRLVG